MNEQITDADIEQLCNENPVASEQLRRIIAERQKQELIKIITESGLEINSNGSS
tara:strand:- start:218 stop:379 length:162 start_codon:yes stop_codon:yes gene_type:complete